MRTILVLISAFSVVLIPLCATTSAQSGWQPVTSGTHSNLGAMDFIGASGVIMGDSSTILYTSDNGLSWMVPCAGSCPQFEWTQFYGPSPCRVRGIAMLTSSDAVLYGGCDFGGSAHNSATQSAMLVSSNAGYSWDRKPSLGPTQLWRLTFKHNSGLATGGWYTMYGDWENWGNSLLHTADGGANWASITLPRIYSGPSRDTVDFLDYFALLDSMNAIGVGNAHLWRTTDIGITWTADTLTCPGSTSIALFAFAPNEITLLRQQTDSLKGNTVYVAQSADWGTHWIVNSAPELWPVVSSSFPDPAHGVVLSDSGRVFFTQDGGAHWGRQQISTKYRLKQVIRLDSLSAIVIGDSGAIFRSADGGVTDVASTRCSPTSLLLQQNYPNPFGTDGHESTTIEYSTPEFGHVSLEICNSLGQRRTLLVDEYQSAGSHRVLLRGHDLANGTYVSHLTLGARSQFSTVLIVK